jgi:16S rRNA (cytosine967-C5)-methyltransferase
MAAKSSRAVAAKVLHSLQGGSSGSLSNLLDDYRERPDFPLLQELCFGACRWYPALDTLLAKLLSKPLKKKGRRCALPADPWAISAARTRYC